MKHKLQSVVTTYKSKNDFTPYGEIKCNLFLAYHSVHIALEWGTVYLTALSNI
jgi:hypothetical protein